MKRVIALILLFIFSCNLNAMCWKWSDYKNREVSVSFIPIESSIGTQVDLVIKCDEVFVKSLPEKYQRLFKIVGENYIYSTNESYQEREQSSFSEEEKILPSKLVCTGNPKRISVEEFSEIIKSRRVIFYTGAGISAGFVPTMDQLMTDLKITNETRNNLKEYITGLIANSESYVSILKDFFDKCENALPSDAHIILSRFIQKWGHLLITENVDQLHQKTGLYPIVFAGHDIYSQGTQSEKIKNEVLKSDFVVTIGLDSDESGFLNFYKELNPNGRIISVNLKNTNYLSDNDLILVGDIQQLFQKITLHIGID